MNTTPGRTLRQVLAMQPEKAMEWIDREGAALPSGAFNWLGFAESSAAKARRTDNTTWAAVSLRAYCRWVSIAMDDSAVLSSRSSTMTLRAYFISRFGPKNGDEVRDLDALVAIFEDGLEGTPQAVAQKARRWSELPVNDIWQLRQIKNRITPMELLDPELLRSYPRVMDWIEIKPLLP